MVKRQQLFNSFWPSLTVAVLATQPAWADTVQVTTVRLKPTVRGIQVILEIPKNTSPPVLTSSYGRTFSADINNTQLRNSQGNSFRASNPTDGITSVTVTPLNAKSIRVTVTGKTGVPVGKVIQSDRGIVLSLSATSDTSLTQLQSRALKSNQMQTDSTISQQQSPAPVQPNRGSAPARNNGNSEVAPSASPNPISPANPSPVGSDIGTTGTPAPSYLNPSPNPLQFPTRNEEVEVQGTQPITLQQAFDLARRNNRVLQEEELTLERSRAFLRQQQAALLPTLSVRGNITDTGRFIFSERPTQEPGEQPPPTGNSSTGASGDLTLSYNVFTSGERRARIRAAEEQLRFDELDVERQTEQLRLDVSNNYYDLQGADEQVRISQAAVRNAEASLRDAQALEQAGVGTRFDVLRSQVQLADEIQNLTNALSNQRTERRQLAAQLSLAQSIDISAADPVEIAGLWNLSLEESIVLAFQNRAELEQQLTQRNISEQNRRIALSDLGPDVSVSARYIPTDTLNDARSFSDSYEVGATVTLNLFEGGAARARAEQEERNIEISEIRFADSRNNIRFEVEQAYADLQSNFTNIQTATVGLEQAREALRLARLRFQAGVGTQTDVINAENDLTDAEGDRVTAILNYNRAFASLQRAITSGQPR